MVVGRTSAKKARPVKKMPAVRKARNATVAKETATPAKGRRKSRADAAQQVYVDLDDDDDYDDAGDGGDKGDPIEIDEDSEGDLDGSDKEMPAAAVKTPIKKARVKKSRYKKAAGGNEIEEVCGDCQEEAGREKGCFRGRGRRSDFSGRIWFRG